MERLILVEYALLWHMHITSLAVSRSPSNSWQVVHTYIVLNRNKHITLLLPITIGSFYLYNLTPEPAFHSTRSATSRNELSKSIRVSEDGERRVESSRFDWCRDSWRQVINQSSSSSSSSSSMDRRHLSDTKKKSWRQIDCIVTMEVTSSLLLMLTMPPLSLSRLLGSYYNLRPPTLNSCRQAGREARTCK